MDTTHMTQNDTIDLRELFGVLKKRKIMILFVTLIAILSAILYAYFMAKPVYEVRALIEIGKIEAGTKNEAPLDNIHDVKEKLTYLYGVQSKRKKEYPRVKSINIPKKSQSVFSIVVEGRDNKSAIDNINQVVLKLERDYAQKINTYIDTQKELISLTKKDIGISQKNLDDIQDTLRDYNEKFLNITQKDAALAGLFTIQISQNQERLQGLQSHISELRTNEFNLKLSIAPLRITKTRIIGDIEILKKPIKPKKALIVIVSFITGLMFAIFLAFFLEFLRGAKEE